jgi:hypothetical protein
MGRYVHAANRVLDRISAVTSRTGQAESVLPVLGGHEVSEILWQTSGMVIFRDVSGATWRWVERWKTAWPVEFGDGS